MCPTFYNAALLRHPLSMSGEVRAVLSLSFFIWELLELGQLNVEQSHHRSAGLWIEHALQKLSIMLDVEFGDFARCRELVWHDGLERPALQPVLRHSKGIRHRVQANKFDRDQIKARSLQ